MKTRDAVDLVFMSTLALAVTILVACTAAFPTQIPPITGYWTSITILFIIVLGILSRIDPQNLDGEKA